MEHKGERRLNAMEIVAVVAVTVTAVSLIAHWRVSRKRNQVVQRERLESEDAPTLAPPRQEREAAARTLAARLGLPKP